MPKITALLTLSSLDYLFQIAVEMFKLNISPSAPVTPVKPEPTPELEIEESD